MNCLSSLFASFYRNESFERAGFSSQPTPIVFLTHGSEMIGLAEHETAAGYTLPSHK